MAHKQYKIGDRIPITYAEISSITNHGVDIIIPELKKIGGFIPCWKVGRIRFTRWWNKNERKKKRDGK